MPKDISEIRSWGLCLLPLFMLMIFPHLVPAKFKGRVAIRDY